MAEPDPLSVKCPHCGAKPRYQCRAVSISGSWVANTHRGRWKAIGIRFPTAEQIVASRTYEKRHHLALMQEFQARQQAKK